MFGYSDKSCPHCFSLLCIFQSVAPCLREFWCYENPPYGQLIFFWFFSCWRFLAQYFPVFFLLEIFKLNDFSGVFLSGLLIYEMEFNWNYTTVILIHPQHCAINKWILPPAQMFLGLNKATKAVVIENHWPYQSLFYPFLLSRNLKWIQMQI